MRERVYGCRPCVGDESHHGVSARRGTSQWASVLLVAVLAFLPRLAYAQDENRAGLVVVFGDGRVEQQCVAFAEESISGYDLLQRSGLPLSIEAGAIGPTVCSIGKDGCSYPQESCFCRCQGSPCIYWSYWRLLEDGAWRYQSLGAGNTQVRDGEVEGWRWAEGTTRDAEEPPAVTFAGVCGEPAQPVAAAMPAMPAGDVTTDGDASVVVTVTMAPAAAAPPAEVAGNTAAGSANRADPAQAGMQPLWLLLAGTIVVPAVVLVVWALVRKGR